MFRKIVKKLTKWVFVPLVLFFVAIILSVFYFSNSDINPNILSYNHQTNSVKVERGMIKGTFTAQENYLGIVTLRFENKESLTGDSLFRIKNILDEDWYHVATIAASQFYTVPQYPFGLPVITNSKNKTFQFEIRFLDTTPASQSPSLSDTYPVLISQYQFPKNILLENANMLITFIQKKIFYYIFEGSSWRILAVYGIPFMLYVFYLIFERKLNSVELVMKVKKKLFYILKPYLFFVFLCIFIDIFIIRKYADSTITLYIFLWIMGAAAYRLESRYSFGMAFIFLLFCPFLLFANMNWMAEKSAVWAYMFLVVGTIHAVIELKASESPKINTLLNTMNIVPSFITLSNTFIVLCIKKIMSFISICIVCIDSLIIACLKNVVKFALFSFRNFIKIFVSFFLITTLFLAGFNLSLKAISYRDRQLKNPRITQIEPTLVYPSTKIVIYGDSFGDNSNNKYALIKDGEKLKVDYWEDHKIIFTVPLNWKQSGEIRLWIEKPVEWNAKIIIERTKPITIRLLKVTGQVTPDDDLYFKQIKTWRKETREINGYQ